MKAKGVRFWTICFELALLALIPAVGGTGPVYNDDARSGHGISLPIVRRPRVSPGLKKRATPTQGAAGLGDYVDVVYNVLVTIGGSTLPVVLDTGSSDLWVTSDACLSGCDNSTKYPQSTFNSTSLEVRLYYGDSYSGTYAFGLIGTDAISIAGLSLPNQYFAAISDTNTSIGEAGSSGIFGLGFPINSAIFNNVLNTEQLRPHTKGLGASKPRRKDTQGQSGLRPAKPTHSTSNFNAPTFPNLRQISRTTSQKTIDTSGTPSIIDTILSSFLTLGPFVSRLVATKSILEPLFTVTLQRDVIEIGGNVGILNIGQLPADVKNESLTWVPIRRYTADEGGLSAPSESPNEVYPITWEVFLDDVYLDSEKLPRSELVPSDIKLSALIDTGNSIIRGPSDVVGYITNKLGTDFPCDEPHTLAFSIGGKLFPVDPRDFIIQAYKNNVSRCMANLLATNAPMAGGFLHSWSLGDPFLKSVLSAYYYGNLSYPSRDPPRMGFLSTVPSDAGDQLKVDVKNAAQNGQNFPSRIEPAPTGSPTGSLFNSEGIATVSGTSVISPTRTSGAIQTLNRLRWASIAGISVLVLVLSS